MLLPHFVQNKADVHVSQSEIEFIHKTHFFGEASSYQVFGSTAQLFTQLILLEDKYLLKAYPVAIETHSVQASPN